jgi:monooxygenase
VPAVRARNVTVKSPQAQASESDVDVLVVGAGLSGISAAWHLRRYCPDQRIAILEARERIGGTWDLFRYPGVRSDSDMYTLGFSFEPWTEDQAIASGDTILRYLDRVVDKHDLRRLIRFNTRVISADFDQAAGRWTVITEVGGQEVRFTARWLHFGTGYYQYDQAHQPDFIDHQHFAGSFFHAQFWPGDLNVRDKRVVVIGSGATAVTLVPELAKLGAAHVTMLQRSPTYIMSRPSIDRGAVRLRRWLGDRLGHTLVRWRNVLLQQFFFQLARRRPGYVKQALRKAMARELPADYAIDTHFKPSYDPWDQRLCLVPDADLFAELRSGRAEVVTDTIERFTRNGLKLTSGRVLPADIVVAATGLKIQLLSDVGISLNGEQRPLAGTITYKGMMFAGVPNLSYSFGYTNASWTLKADLTSLYLTRLLNHLSATGTTIACPVLEPGVDPLDILDFTSGYIQRAKDILPKQGNRAPWRLHQNYIRDLAALKYGRVDDGVMRFSPSSTSLVQPEKASA